MRRMMLHMSQTNLGDALRPTFQQVQKYEKGAKESARAASNTSFGMAGLGDKNFQVMWGGAKYTVTDNLDVIGGYYHYIQDSYFGTVTAGAAPCSSSAHPQCAGTFDALSAAIDWRFAPKWDVYAGLMFSQVNGGLAFGFFQRNNIDPTVGLRFRF
jgi:hypothetical protein